MKRDCSGEQVTQCARSAATPIGKPDNIIISCTTRKPASSIFLRTVPWRHPCRWRSGCGAKNNRICTSSTACMRPRRECLAKGKAHKRYEFGCKVSAVTVLRRNLVLNIEAGLAQLFAQGSCALKGWASYRYSSPRRTPTMQFTSTAYSLPLSIWSSKRGRSGKAIPFSFASFAIASMF